MGGVVIEAHVHGLPAPTVKYYRDGHLLHARKNKIVFFHEGVEKEIFQCLLVRPDSSISGTYTVLAENKAGKKRFDHHVDYVTKYSTIHYPLIRHADKKLDDFVEMMLEKVPKHPEPQPEVEQPPVEQPAEEVKPEPEAVTEAQAEIPETPKAEEIAEALQAVVEGEAAPAAPEAPKEEKKKHKSKHHRHHHKKRAESPKIDADLVNDGEDEPADAVEEPEPEYKRRFSTVVHEPYEEETFRIFNAKDNLVWSGKLRDQTAIELSTVKMICAVSGPRPVIKWTKNGKPISWGQTMRNMSGEGLGIVIIEKIQKSDAGVYQCAARNGNGEIVTEATIKVIPRSTVPTTDASKPAFTRVLDESYHHTEDDLVLEAHVRAVPDPKITWFKDGVELTAASDKRYDFSSDHDGGYQFRIHRPNAEDSALYACEAVNDEGRAKISHKVNFTNLERHTHPQFVYHKESFRQPTLKPVLEPEPVREASPVYEYTSKISDPVAQLLEQARIEAEKIEAARVEELRAAKAKLEAERREFARQQAEEEKKKADAEKAEEAKKNGDGSGVEGGEGGESTEQSDETKEISDEAPEEGEEAKPAEAEAEKKPEKRSRGPRRKRYEGPVEPLLIRDSVKKITKSFQARLFD